VTLSGNQVGCLATLAFFEEVDRLVEKGHLFKRTVALVKCWAVRHNIFAVGSPAHSDLATDQLAEQVSSDCIHTLVASVFNAFHHEIFTVTPSC